MAPVHRRPQRLQRGSAVRGPPVSSRKRSDSSVAICSTDSIRSRAAASSIASGSPSSSLQTRGHGRARSRRSARSRGAPWRARSTNSATASEPASVAVRRRGSGSDSDGTRQSVSPSDTQWRPARGQHDDLGSGLQQRLGRRRRTPPADARSCRAPPAPAARPDRRQHACSSVMPGSGRTPSASAIAAPTSSALGERRQLDPPGAVREPLQRAPRRPAARAASCRSRPRPSASPAARPPRAAQLGQLALAADEARQRHRQVVRQRCPCAAAAISFRFRALATGRPSPRPPSHNRAVVPGFHVARRGSPVGARAHLSRTSPGPARVLDVAAFSRYSAGLQLSR